MSAEDELRVVIAAAAAGVDAGAAARRAGGAGALLRAAPRRLSALGIGGGLVDELRLARHADPAAYVAALAARGIRCVTRSDPAYPARVAELHDPPLALFLAGAGPADGGTPALAVVGARRAGDGSLALAARLAAFAAGRGVRIVSGLALGIDAAGHRGALDAGGATVAVLGCGPDVSYPRANAALRRRIEVAGAIVSEYPPGTPPAPWRFPARNRIIAALADAVLVVEARARSGALITADHALDLGRDVLAVPGAANAPRAAGTNGLLRAGAGLVEHEDDLAGWLGLDPPEQVRPPEAARALLDAVASGPAFADELAGRVGRSAAEVGAQLAVLELDGWVAADASGRYLAARPVG
jgi:DNA processing protein